MNGDKALRLLGMARRAGKLRLGLREALEARDIRLLALAGDAGGNTVRNALRLSEEQGLCLVTVPQSKTELGKALGKTSCSLAAVLDEGFAQAIRVSLAGEASKELR